MRVIRFACTIVFGLLCVQAVYAQEATEPDGQEAVLYDFENGADDWAQAALHDVKDEEPEVKVATTDQGATRGQRALALTFSGGRWPAVATSEIPVKGNWQPYQTLRADFTVDRPTIAFFRVQQQKPTPNDDGSPAVAYWTRTMILQPGRNDVVLTIRRGSISGSVIYPNNGDITRFFIGAYRPVEGQVLHVDNIRLDRRGPQARFITMFSPYSWDGYSSAAAAELARTLKLPTFTAAGTDLVVSDVQELGKKLASQWQAPEPNTLEQVEADFRATYEQIRQQHPKAVLSVLRDGEKGYDPADPEKVYAGWKDAYITSHGPDGPMPGREANEGKRTSTEVFMRHRSPLMRVDLSVIPQNATIHAAQLVLPRHVLNDLRLPSKPHLWVVEPLARHWEEYEVTGYWAAKNDPWKAVNGTYYGQDGDFHPIFLAHGFGNAVNVFDFVHAVRFWQTHDNHGFMVHGDSNDYMRISTREEQNIRLRPAVYVIWEPAE